MKMHWIIQNNLFSEAGFQKLIDALERLGSSYSLHKVVPFAHTLEPEFEASGPVVVMGSYTLAKIAKERGWQPGAWVGENFAVSVQRRRWAFDMLNSDATILKLGCVARDDSELAEEQQFFIRPNDDSKAFVGQVMDWPSFVEWQDKVLALTPDDCPTVTDETVVVVAPVKPISREWRTWIVNGRVVTASQYKLGSRKVESADVDQRVINFANAMSTIWRGGDLVAFSDDYRATWRESGEEGDDLAPAYCLDVFESEGELYIGEVNNLNSAGFYAGDMQKLVMAIEEMVR